MRSNEQSPEGCICLRFVITSSINDFMGEHTDVHHEPFSVRWIEQ